MDHLTRVAVTHPWWILVAAALVSVGLSIWSARTLQLDADTDSLIGEHQPFMRNYRAFKRDFGDLEYLIVAVDPTQGGRHAPRRAEAERAVSMLLDRLRALPGLRRAEGQVTPAEQWRLAPWHMDAQALERLLLARGAIAEILRGAAPGQLLQLAQSRLKGLGAAALSGPGGEAPRMAADAVMALQAIAAGSPEGAGGFGLAEARAPEWLRAPGGEFLFVRILPDKDYGTLSVIQEPLERIREVIRQVRAAVPDVDIGLTGKPVLQADEMATTNQDMTWSSVAAFVLVAGLFMAVFRGVKRPLLANLAFGVGCALTYGAATLLVGRLNLLSLVFMLVLVGVGLDYGIHMIARYMEAHPARDRREAIASMMRRAVPSNLSGALTSGGVFLLAWFTTFQGLRELGLIAGLGLILCWAAMAVVLPALLEVFDRRPREGGATFISGRPGGAAPRPGGRMAALAWLLPVGAVAGAAFAWGPAHIRFESNLLKLQAAGLEAVEWEGRILADSSSATWFGAVIVDRVEQVPGVVAKARAEPTVGAVQSILDVVSLPTPESDALRATLASLRPDPAPGASADAPLPVAALLECATGVEALAPLAEVQAPAEAVTLRNLAARLRSLAAAMDPAAHDGAMIDARRQSVVDAVARTRDALAGMAAGAALPLRAALPDALRDDVMSPNGRFCVMIHPRSDVWELEPMEAFVAALRRIDPEVTGVPITQLESMRLMERSFLQQGVAAALLVMVVLWLDFRSVRETAIAMITLAVGLGWTLAFMIGADLDFNLANFFAIPITVGLGADGCIHLLHRLRESPHGGFGSTRRAVTVTALTTVIGFGTLLWAHHRGLRSLGLLMTVSTVAILAATVFVLPAIHRVWAPVRRERRIGSP